MKYGHKRDAKIRKLGRVAAAGAPVVLGLAASNARAAELYVQDFESLPLLPLVSPTETGGTGEDWTSQAPAGWTRNQGFTPASGPVEFFGFNFMNKGAWVATETDQDRGLFTRGTGTVMVADPDAYDDAGEIDPDLFNVTMQTQPISLVNVVPGTARVNFDSSFRPYDTMTASVEVSFDDGNTFANLLSMNSANVPGGDSSLERVNEAISLAIATPAGGGEMIIRFGMSQAGNDWWWAVDNLQVTADVVPEPGSGLALLGFAGIAALRRKRD